MNPLRQAVKSVLTAILPSRLWMTRGPADSQAVALTFDDGPHPEHTPRVLDELAAHGVLATFFVVGRSAHQYPDLLDRIVAAGHAVGHHSYQHAEPDFVSASELAAEVRRCRGLIEDVTGCPSLLFRPPKGKLTLGKMCELWKQRQSIVLWNVDSRDYQLASRVEIDSWSAAYSPHAGDIVLLHDSHPRAAEAIPQLVGRVRERGLSFARISDWLPATANSRPQPSSATEGA